MIALEIWRNLILDETTIPEEVEEYMERKWTMQKVEQRMILKIRRKPKKNAGGYMGSGSANNQNEMGGDSDSNNKR